MNFPFRFSDLMVQKESGEDGIDSAAEQSANESNTNR
ncbi:hypothetical protein AGRO_1030 [Agrobacterium sp. ATCC 31749]|nr:hypothetical protein AGRO_1030 [Agrobacterium sp. ATCC 31749]